MTTKKEKAPIDPTKEYQSCIDAIFSINSLIQEYFEPHVFSTPMIYIDKKALDSNHTKFLTERKKAEDSYKAFIKHYNQNDKKGALSDDDVTFRVRLDGLLPIFKKTMSKFDPILNHHLAIKNQIEEVTLTQKVNMYPLSFMPTFEKMLAGTMESSEHQIDLLIPAVQRGVDLGDATYIRLKKVYLSNLELDLAYEKQMQFWREQKPTKKQLNHMELLDKMLLYIHQMNGDILMSVCIMEYYLVPEIALMKQSIAHLHNEVQLLQSILQEESEFH